MIYTIAITPEAREGIERHSKSGNKNLVTKIYHLFTELKEHPRTGTGKPEQLRGRTEEVWSRRIDAKHRLVYEIHDDELIIVAVSTYGHYGDK